MMKVNIKRVDKNSVIPKYQTDGSAGFDFHSCEDVTILPGQVIAVNTGIAFEIPDNFEIQVRSRSGHALKSNLFVLNSPGTIDSDYRLEVKVILCNASNKNFSISVGDRIAQGVLCPIEKASWNEVDELSETNRKGGFGSTNL